MREECKGESIKGVVSAVNFVNNFKEDKNPFSATTLIVPFTSATGEIKEFYWIEDQKLGQQDDVKALGVLLYEMVDLKQYSQFNRIGAFTDLPKIPAGRYTSNLIALLNLLYH